MSPSPRPLSRATWATTVVLGVTYAVAVRSTLIPHFLATGVAAMGSSC